MDILWFFPGEDNATAKSSSGGGILPGIVAKNAEDNETSGSTLLKVHF